MMKNETIKRMINRPSAYGIGRFSTLSAAKKAAEACRLPQCFLLGCDGKIWSTHARNASLLHKAGYEYAD